MFSVCVVWVQSRGFKTLRSRTRRAESGYDGPVESEAYTPGFMKVCHHTTDVSVALF